MGSKNRSIRVPHDQIEGVEGFLRSSGLKKRRVKNTLWSYEGKGVYLNMYPSGILLIQGRDGDRWAEKILERIEPPEGPLAGCDEVGKGDIFGPLVLCCAVIPPESFRKVLSLAPKDSKIMKDEEVLQKAEKLKRLVRTRCIVLMPERLNELYERYGNINRLMDDAYRKLILKIREEFNPERTYVDRYSGRNPFQDIEGVLFFEKGERDVAVSVASIIARAKFLRKVKELEGELGRKIPKGASPEAKELAHSILREKPQQAKRFLKLSFIQS